MQNQNIRKKRLKRHNAAFELLKENVKNGDIIDLEVISDSMSPLIKTGNKISVKKINPSKLKKGDIIAYKIKKSISVHRLIRKIKNNNNQLELITKGDNKDELDKQSIPSNDLLGKVILIHRGNKKIKISGFFWRIKNLNFSFLSNLKSGA